MRSLLASSLLYTNGQAFSIQTKLLVSLRTSNKSERTGDGCSVAGNPFCISLPRVTKNEDGPRLLFGAPPPKAGCPNSSFQKAILTPHVPLCLTPRLRAS